MPERTPDDRARGTAGPADGAIPFPRAGRILVVDLLGGIGDLVMVLPAGDPPHPPPPRAPPRGLAPPPPAPPPPPPPRRPAGAAGPRRGGGGPPPPPAG